jgi:uncharacterized protein (DUF1697 family)
MVIYISLIRGINVGGKKVKMSQLNEIYLSLNFKDVKTYIQSGNVVFRSQKLDLSYLRKIIENKIEEMFGFDVKVLIRTKTELKNVLEENPFKRKDLNHLYITFLSEVPSINLIKDLNRFVEVNMKNKSDKFYISKKEIYIFLPNGYGRTKLNNNFFEKKLGVTATTRNLKSVNKLLDIADSLSIK